MSKAERPLLVLAEHRLWIGWSQWYTKQADSSFFRGTKNNWVCSPRDLEVVDDPRNDAEPVEIIKRAAATMAMASPANGG